LSADGCDACASVDQRSGDTMPERMETAQRNSQLTLSSILAKVCI
jgi:hypothetical protein